jgi:hypothetical protein
MCTLTYLLTKHGFEIYFNRDEQRTRLLALPPQFDPSCEAIYPIDANGHGTWLAVAQSGLCLALLNNYQAAATPVDANSISRGQLILSLLADVQNEPDIMTLLQTIDLTVYQPFVLCIFPSDLTLKKRNIDVVKWGASLLTQGSTDLPITSSSVDFKEVCLKRQQRFAALVDKTHPQSEQLKAYHYSTEAQGKHSVQMSREDARTVSVSHVSVTVDSVSFEYFDGVQEKKDLTTEARRKVLGLR